MHRPLFVALLFASSVGAFAQSAQFILVERRANFEQDGNSTVNVTGPLEFEVSLQNGSNLNLVTSATFTSPGGAGVSGGTLAIKPSDQSTMLFKRSYTQDGTGANSMLSDFPAGTYNVTVSNGSSSPTVAISLPGDASSFPDAVGAAISLSIPGTWFNNTYYFDPTAAANLTVSSNYAGPGTSNHGDFSLSGNNTSLDNGGAFNSPSMSWAIPTSSFVTGQTYDLEVDWSNIVSFTQLATNYSFLNGATAAGAFSIKTDLFLVAGSVPVPEPATMVLWLGAAAGALALIRRRTLQEA